MNRKNVSSDANTIEQLSKYLMQEPSDCELCRIPGGDVVWEDDFCRVVLVADPNYPGFCRVILREHLAEMSDLDPAAQSRLMQVVLATESVLRQLYQPDKMNLASFGNVVPHLHWHVIPRWRDDRHFPQPVWGTPQRVGSPARPPVPGRRIGEEIARQLGN